MSCYFPTIYYQEIFLKTIPMHTPDHCLPTSRRSAILVSRSLWHGCMAWSFDDLNQHCSFHNVQESVLYLVCIRSLLASFTSCYVSCGDYLVDVCCRECKFCLLKNHFNSKKCKVCHSFLEVKGYGVGTSEGRRTGTTANEGCIVEAHLGVGPQVQLPVRAIL